MRCVMINPSLIDFPGADQVTTEQLIQMQDVSKIYLTDEAETIALDKISLVIDRGEYVSITGPSGCGKSTLLSVMGLLSDATGGRYLFNGAEATGLNSGEQASMRNRRIGFVFQAFNLISDMNVFENVELPLTFRGDLKRKQRHEIVSSALNRVNLSARQNHLPAQLSGGQQQRVAIARALAGNPSVLLADEPTGNLDSTNAHLIMDLLDTLHAQGSTIVIVTHDPRFAERAERQISLFDGRIVEDRPTRVRTGLVDVAAV
jgi:putative ABC transport system ATP-binding protein